MILLVALALAMPAAGASKKSRSKREKVSTGEVFASFVAGEERVLAWSGRDRVFLLETPELRVASQFRIDEDRRVEALSLSKDQRWLATLFRGGPLVVWEVDTEQRVLEIAERVSLGFAFHPEEPLLILFQPRIGITQWNLASRSRVEPTIAGAEVFFRNIAVSPNGKFLWIGGRCRTPEGDFDLCLFDLRDGTAVAWANDLFDDRRAPTEKDSRLLASFDELLDATGFIDRRATRGSAVKGCRRLAEGKLFCCSQVSVALTDDSLPPQGPQPASGGGKWMQSLGVPTVQEMSREFPGRYLWEIRASQDRKRMLIDSCDLSEDGRWVLAGVNGRRVELFSTEELEPKSLRLIGSWRQPVLVGSHEFD